MLNEIQENEILSHNNEPKAELEQVTLDAEKIAEIRAKLDAENKKLVEVPDDVSPEIKHNVTEVLIALHELKEEVLLKRQEALDKSSSIKKKVEFLVHSGKVRVDEDEYKKSEKSVNQYAKLLENIIFEIEGELFALIGIATDKHPSYYVVAKNDEASFPDYIKEKISLVKKYVRNIRKDLNVSYSRYCFGFDSQMKRILYIEHVVKAELEEKQAA